MALSFLKKPTIGDIIDALGDLVRQEVAAVRTQYEIKEGSLTRHGDPQDRQAGMTTLVEYQERRDLHLQHLQGLTEGLSWLRSYVDGEDQNGCQLPSDGSGSLLYGNQRDSGRPDVYAELMKLAEFHRKQGG